MIQKLLVSLNWADCFIIAVITISMLLSLIRGFVREVLSLATWVVAFVVAFKFSGKLAVVFAGYLKTPSLRLAIAFAILFIITLILGGLFGFLLSQLIVKTGLSGTDRILGMVFGVARGVLVITVLLLLVTVTTHKDAGWEQHSVLIPHFRWLVHWLRGFLPAKMVGLAKTASITAKKAVAKAVVAGS